MPKRLAALKVPVLAICGAADRSWDPASARQYDAVPNARVELLPGVGHVPLLEAPETTSKLLLGLAATGRDAGRAEDRLRTAASWDERFVIAAEILGRRPAGRRIDPEVAYAWRRTLTGGGRLRVDGLADEVGWSRKRPWSRFRSQLGISPKHAARLVRFDHAAHLLAAGHAPASVAGGSGYVDQSHLHREFSAFTGLTPTAVATAPWLAVDDVAWPPSTEGRVGVRTPKPRAVSLPLVGPQRSKAAAKLGV